MGWTLWIGAGGRILGSQALHVTAEAGEGEGEGMRRRAGRVRAETWRRRHPPRLATAVKGQRSSSSSRASPSLTWRLRLGCGAMATAPRRNVHTLRTTISSYLCAVVIRTVTCGWTEWTHCSGGGPAHAWRRRPIMRARTAQSPSTCGMLRRLRLPAAAAAAAAVAAAAARRSLRWLSLRS